MCVLRVYGARHADGARVGDAQQTRRSHARSCTHKSSIPSQCPVSQHLLSKHPVPVLTGYEDEAREHGTRVCGRRRGAAAAGR